MADREDVRTGWAKLLDAPPDSDSVEALCARSQVRRFGAGETMIGQEDSATDVLLILSGTARVARLTENGHEVWLSDLEAGTLVGDMAILIDSPRTSAVIASTDLEAVRLDGRVFDSFLRQDAKIAHAMTTLLAHRLKRASDLLVDQIAMDVEGRLYSLLVHLSAASGDDAEVLVVRPEPVVNNLADRIHATREATSRALSSLRKRGLIKQGDGHWRVIRPAWMP